MYAHQSLYQCTKNLVFKTHHSMCNKKKIYHHDFFLRMSFWWHVPVFLVRQEMKLFTCQRYEGENKGSFRLCFNKSIFDVHKIWMYYSKRLQYLYTSRLNQTPENQTSYVGLYVKLHTFWHSLCENILICNMSKTQELKKMKMWCGIWNIITSRSLMKSSTGVIKFGLVSWLKLV